jgi:hypothetical protein
VPRKHLRLDQERLSRAGKRFLLVASLKVELGKLIISRNAQGIPCYQIFNHLNCGIRLPRFNEAACEFLSNLRIGRLKINDFSVEGQGFVRLAGENIKITDLA